MDPTISQQIFEHLKKSNQIAIVLPETLTADNIGSAVAMSLFLRKQDKEVTIVSSGKVPSELEFLTKNITITNSLSHGSSFVISIATTEKPVDEISYQSEAGKLNIYIKPKKENYVPGDVSLTADGASYQALIVLDCPTLESVGKLFEQHAEVFFSTAKINIDNHPGNEYFGAINYVDINATSIGEMLADLFETSEQQFIDEDIATSLLAGIITKTNSFQHIQTTPKAFAKASQLIALGGRQQEIIRSLYKTKSLSLLRLWGRALARLKAEPEQQLLYSMVSEQDMEKSGGSEADLVKVLKELLDNTSNYKIVALLAEQDGGVKVLCALHPQLDAKQLSNAVGTQLVATGEQLGQMQVFQGFLNGETLTGMESKLLAFKMA